MAAKRPKPRRDFHAVGWLRDFAFSPEERDELIRITRIDRAAFIDGLEERVREFLFDRDIELNKPTDADVKAALHDLEAKSTDMLESLRLDQRTTVFLTEPLWAARENTDILDRLKEDLRTIQLLSRDRLRDHEAILTDERKKPRGKRRGILGQRAGRTNARSQLARMLALRLKDYGVTPTGTCPASERGDNTIFHDTLKLCLVTTGEVEGHADISRLVKETIAEMA